MTDDPESGRPVGARMNDYVWDGAHWVPQVDSIGSTFDGANWHRPPPPGGPAFGAPQPMGFAHPAYAFAFTRRASDDIAFIARWTKIFIIVALVMMALNLVFGVLAFGWLLSALGGLLATLEALLPR